MISSDVDESVGCAVERIEADDNRLEKNSDAGVCFDGGAVDNLRDRTGDVSDDVEKIKPRSSLIAENARERG